MLKAFLTARQAYIMQCLSAATGAGADTDLDSLAFILADVATMVGLRTAVPCSWLHHRAILILLCLILEDTTNTHPSQRSLCGCCLQVCATVAQCGELFLQLPGVSATPLLVQALAADDGSSVDLLFDSAGKEAEAWKVGVLQQHA